MKDHIYKIPEEHVYIDLDKLERVVDLLTRMSEEQDSDTQFDEHYKRGVRTSLEIVKYFMS